MIRIPSLILIVTLVMVSSGGFAEETPQPPGSTIPETGGPEEPSPQTNPAGNAAPDSGSTQDQGSTQPTEPGSSQESPSSSASSPQEQPATQEKASEPSPESAPAEASPQPPGPTPTTQEQVAPKEESQAEKVLETSEEEKKRTVSTAVESTGATLIRGRLEIDIAQSYSHSDNNQLFIEGFGILPILTVGDVSVHRIRRDTFTTRLSVRYKLTPSLQVSVTQPFQYSLVRVSEVTGISGSGTVSPNTDDLSRGYGWGDLNGGLDYQLFTEGAVRPAIYLSLSFTGRTGRDAFETTDPAAHPPTGSGFNSIGMATSFVKVADPAVVTGGLSFTYPIPRHNALFQNGGNPIKVDITPGLGFGAQLGLSYALNYKVSLSTSVSQSVSLPTKVGGQKLNNSSNNAISISFGTTWRWTDRTSISVSVGRALTLDAPSSTISMRIPYRF
jgi:hypothetical protein